MIVSLDWLKDFVSFKLAPQELADLLTGAGLESTVGENGDTLDIELTPNRPDCMSHLGVAREIALLTDAKLKQDDISLSESDQPVEDAVTIIIEDEKGSPRYSARVVKGIKVGASPDWMVQRLEQCGIRSINSVVDISNYVLLELGHPLHTFDLGLVEGETIIVRSAKKNEKIVTLDGENRKLSSDHLLICDSKKPVGLAGIMGGENTEVTQKTTDVLIECAYFDPVTIRKGAKKLDLSSEASRRFERGANYDDVTAVLDRTAQLITQIAGGEICAGMVDCYPKVIKPKKVLLNRKRAESSIGVAFDDKFIRSTLGGLGIGHKKKNDQYECVIPSFRPDLEREIDLCEELARVYGFDKIESKTAYVGDVTTILADEERTVDELRDYFSGMGFNEVMTNSLLSEQDAQTFSELNPLPVANPLSREMSVMRPSLLPGLLGSVNYNLRRGENDLSLFEYGNIFQAEEKKWAESPQFSGVACGDRVSKGWRQDQHKNDFYLLKGVVCNLVQRFGFDGSFTELENSSVFSYGMRWETSSGWLADIGSVNNEILGYYDIGLPVVSVNLNLELFNSSIEAVQFSKLPQFPSIDRDLSLSVPSSVTIGELESIIQENGTDLLRVKKLYDLYGGDQIESGMQGVTFSLSFRSDDRTLQDDEVDTIMEKIISETSSQVDAKLR
ncbi:MAG: phenylalanine--tRNA ligase subunit beta [Candidatus Marinimicrobia bacterium]|jgi:phenylalanyl-tRNA synthetase beta chain|nr:phenylalanine--tRNA ligase subunit beta [Candidatus Neomarinimicrobiota bacterium]MDP7059649.1 phenylalanine--tRNA ligase subunit beta [Candidatus Neomarinimicrobiota bacterium]|tara:strand:+ start:2166 stop:4184 length:2019 start_codon:yes stop_codon:yes gene_type:complete